MIDRIKAKISYVGRGKFNVLEYDKSRRYSNIGVDPSDTFHYREYALAING